MYQNQFTLKITENVQKLYKMSKLIMFNNVNQLKFS